jgi:hypothetical protein
MTPEELREAVARAIYEQKGVHRSTSRDWSRAVEGDRHYCIGEADARRPHFRRPQAMARTSTAMAISASRAPAMINSSQGRSEAPS